MYQPDKPQANPIKLNEYELKELRIIKQAILKSAIEGGQIKKKTEVTYGGIVSTDGKKEALTRPETDEEFLERWIKWVFRETEKDFKLVKEQDQPF